MKILNNLQGLKEKNVKFFVILVVLYNGVVSILNIFMNTFLLNSLGRNQVLTYNLLLGIIQPIAMITSLYVSNKIGYLNSQRIGFCFYAIVFIALCIFGEKISFLYYLFCAFISFGAGYFFAVYSIQMLKYANDGNRDIIQGATTMFAAVISILLPLLSGVIIKYTGDESGYKIVFGIVVVLVLFALLSSYKLHDLGKKETKVNILTVAKKILSNKNGRRIMIANCIDNGRSFTLLFFIPVILNTLNKDPMLVSVNSTISNIASILSASLYGLILNKGNRKYSILIASLISIIGCSILWVNYSVVTIIIFATLFTLTSGYISSPILSTHFKVVDSIEGLSNFGAEVHIVREFFVSIGRTIGVTLIFLLPQSDKGVILVIFILLLLNFISYLMVRNIEKSFQRQASILGN